MPSPFPGMDPYLEDPAIWSDFHGSFLVNLRAELNRILPAGYVARWDRYLWIDDSDQADPDLLGKPDTYIAKLSDSGVETPTGTESFSHHAIAAPFVLQVPQVESKGRAFVKVIDTRTHRVITFIELFSRNKLPGKDRSAYLTKRQEYFQNKVNLVEMDLLRAGKRASVEGKLPAADYYVIVSRAEDYPDVGVWPLTVRDSLPEIQIPLQAGEAPVMLPLRPCLDRVYEEGCFAEEINYDEPPRPPLSDSDAQWAQTIIQQRKTTH